MNIYVWGAGRLNEYVARYVDFEKIAGFIDNNKNLREHMGKKVFRPEDMAHMEYDAILVSTLFAPEIREQCVQTGIDLSKVIFLYGHQSLNDFNQDYHFVEKVLGREYAEVIKKRYHVVRSMETKKELCFEGSEFENTGYSQNDYIRYKTFELAVDEIRKNNIAGEVAELGVFRGEFAQLIHAAFPDRKCYLFDTFEGFGQSEAAREVDKGFATRATIEAHKNTSVETVMKKMKYPEKIVIKKGFFPDSLEGLEERFAFVSIDVDFEDSIYEGIKYFYPRLEKGGYIFLHDYNDTFCGVEHALDRYEAESGKVAKVPLCDAHGSMVITK